MYYAVRYLPLLLLCAAAPAHAQQPLAGTAWQGTIYAPDLTEVVFQFKRDTLIVFNQASKSAIETMRYAQKGNQLTWNKISGDSPCDPSITGTYVYLVTDGRLAITAVKDECAERRQALTGVPMKKTDWPTR